MNPFLAPASIDRADREMPGTKTVAPYNRYRVSATMTTTSLQNRHTTTLRLKDDNR